MIFRSVEDNDLKGRFESETGRWEIGWENRTFGRLQLAVGLAESDMYQLQYCCGDQPEKQLEIMMMVMIILTKLPENISARELEKCFPEWKIRPIYDDPKLMAKLRELSK